MKRTPKIAFFIVLVLILGLAYTSFFGVHSYYGDRRDTIIRGASEIRFGIDIKGGVEASYGPKDETIKADEDQVNAIKNIIEERLVGNNITDYEVYADVDNSRVLVRFPWQSDETDYDATAAIEELGETAQLEFHYGKETETVTNADGTTSEKPTGELIFTGEGVKKATAMMQQNENGSTSAVVKLELQGDAVTAFAKATQTQQASQGAISIWLDDTMISAPTVNAAITDGVAIIEGIGEYEDAVDLANKINAGSLPFDIEPKTYGSVMPTLGEKALDAMVLAGIIAFALIIVYVILWYRLPGFVAAIALLGQVAGSLAFISGYFSFMQSFTLTLPGIAGVILSIGIGVDANVITAERVREELRRGKTIDGAIRAGSKNSFWAIFDGNITVLIISIVLMGVFGPSSSLWAWILKPFLWMFPQATTGMIYSFGYTLLVGVIMNFVMSVALSRLMLRSISRYKIFRKPWLYGGERK